MDFAITSDHILGFCAIVAALWGLLKTAAEIIKTIKEPSDEVKKKLAEHDRWLRSDNERLKDAETSSRMILQCLEVIMNHEITGNSVDKMKEARDKLHEYLIEK